MNKFKYLGTIFPMTPNGTRTLLIVFVIFVAMLVFALMNRANLKKNESSSISTSSKSFQTENKTSVVSKVAVFKVSLKPIQVEEFAQIKNIGEIGLDSSGRAKLEDEIRKFPRHWGKYEELGNLFLEEGFPSEAIKLAKDCLQIDNYAPYCNDILIKAYEAIGDDTQLEIAISDCRKFRDGDFFCVQKARDYMLAHGDRIGASQIISENYPNSAEGQEILARFYFFTKEIEKSWSALNRACVLGDQYCCKVSAKGYDAYKQRK